MFLVEEKKKGEGKYYLEKEINGVANQLTDRVNLGQYCIFLRQLKNNFDTSLAKFRHNFDTFFRTILTRF